LSPKMDALKTFLIEEKKQTR
jgi:hypothetical protein